MIQDLRIRMRTEEIVELNFVRKTEEVFQGYRMLKVDFRKLTKIRISSHDDEEMDERQVLFVGKAR
ncbi:MAG: hypothetical protein CAPSK01_003670 [Candidatus Accumulibacter vicinus]|uniref:Uncharacterized protein n=1 Tax=Candidatus Accumulibacter vicinus TaxID=2954382 RepID=A0A084XW88_9PROT|nr:MAG: hypothetical protein CAPSK01_003670 [Candidatus Accumulibacter vicinus]